MNPLSSSGYRTNVKVQNCELAAVLELMGATSKIIGGHFGEGPAFEGRPVVDAHCHP
jgi:hypothetical protein